MLVIKKIVFFYIRILLFICYFLVHYQLGEDARLIRTGKYDQPGSNNPNSNSSRGREKNHALIALSPNAEVLAIATSSNLAFYSTLTGELDSTIEDIFSGNEC